MNVKGPCIKNQSPNLPLSARRDFCSGRPQLNIKRSTVQGIINVIGILPLIDVLSDLIFYLDLGLVAA